MKAIEQHTSVVLFKVVLTFEGPLLPVPLHKGNANSGNEIELILDCLFRELSLVGLTADMVSSRAQMRRKDT